ncbi:MAG TPA: hypothetical protein VFD94_12630 [Jatrophihabitans sp.]|jgi:hypothetical protein|nr:hypothetical protein [Jatrophihabitans sp.]
MNPTEQHFAFEFAPLYRLSGLPFGITEHTSDITVTETELRVRFGPWRVRTPLDNIRLLRLTGPYGYLKTAGPARLTLSDRGLIFATNSRRGVCLAFHDPITGIEPTGRLRHPNLTLTPVDCTGLLTALGHPTAEDGPER